MDKLNVCLINDSFPPAIDGVANAVTNYARVISRELGHAAVVTPYYPGADDSGYGYPVYRYPSLDTTKLVGYRAGMPFSSELMATLTGADFDIIHSHCPVSSTMLACCLRQTADIPVVMTYHTKFDVDIANAIRGKLLQESAQKLLVSNISACDEVWTVSRGAGENLKALGYEGEYTVMPNGVDFPVGRVDAETIERACGGVDLPAGVPVFLFVGRLMWYKGIRIILDALAALEKKSVDFRMVFIGAGGDGEEMRSYTEGLGLDRKVFFLGPIHDRELIRAWYCRADLFLFPSTFDTNGLVVREAAACGLASVLIRGSCAAEDVEDMHSGFLIEENADSMAVMLEGLCAHPEKAGEVGETAQREIYMSWDESVRRAYERYFAVIDKYRSGGYPKHVKSSAELFAAMAELLELRARSKAAQEKAREEFTRGYSGLKEGIRGGKLRAEKKLEDFWNSIERFM